MPRCINCHLPIPGLSFTGTCGQCYNESLFARTAEEQTADLKARQARRRELKPQLADILRQRAANRAEIARKILTFVGFDLPGQ